jgi:hypothetical protein
LPLRDVFIENQHAVQTSNCLFITLHWLNAESVIAYYSLLTPKQRRILNWQRTLLFQTLELSDLGTSEELSGV